MQHTVEVGFQTFVADGAEEFGAVRQVLMNGDIVVYVENAGEFVVSQDAIQAVHADKVILRYAKLGDQLRDAIGHAHDAEEQ